MTHPAKSAALIPTAAVIALLVIPSSFAADPPKKKKDRPLERTRKTVRMLDDIYKGGIVAITKNYVNDKDTIPAGTAFKEVFKSAEAKGWHKVRLVDGLGEPLNDENAPEDDFEKEALKALVSGKTQWFEKVETEDGKRTLRVATPVPVVFEKCIMCHDNYEGVPAGQAIGALTYKIKVE